MNGYENKNKTEQDCLALKNKQILTNLMAKTIWMKLGEFMKKIIIGLLALTTISAQAGIFDVETDTTEIANAMAHCSKEVVKLLPANRRFNVNNVVGRFAELSEGVTVKGYDITTQEGGGFEFPTKGKTLSIELTVTQPPRDVQDAPAKMEWDCSIH